MKAFPSKNAPYYINEDGASAHQSGMDLRDYFAAKALQALLVTRNDASYLDKMPKICYQWADAMMEARGK
jgi:hypothetical protein